MQRTPRAAFLDAEPSLDGSTLNLLFRYGFHLKKAIEQRALVEGLVKQTFGPEIGLEMRLKEQPVAQQLGDLVSPADLTHRPAVTAATHSHNDDPVTDRWAAVLDRLPRTPRAAFLDAQPSLDGSTLRVWFRYPSRGARPRRCLPVGSEVSSSAIGTPRPASPRATGQRRFLKCCKTAAAVQGCCHVSSACRTNPNSDFGRGPGI